jgi:hypothetical protein
MDKKTWKKFLLGMSIIWVLVTIYSVYSATYAVLNLHWHQFWWTCVVFVLYTLATIAVGVAGD